MTDEKKTAIEKYLEVLRGNQTHVATPTLIERQQRAERVLAMFERAGINPDGMQGVIDVLQEILKSGIWFSSALEIDIYEGFDGEELKAKAEAALALALEERS